MRDLAFQLCQMKQKTVVLGIAVGSMFVLPNLTFEFKSSGRDHAS